MKEVVLLTSVVYDCDNCKRFKVAQKKHEKTKIVAPFTDEVLSDDDLIDWFSIEEDYLIDP